MRCNYCHSEIPNDSSFCPICGKKTASPTPPTPPPAPPAPPRYTAAPAAKTTFCRRCGKPIDEKTKRCLGCGKQYFRGVPPLVFLCIVLTLALIGLMAVCVMQEIHYHARINELEQLIAFYKSI